MERSRLVRVVMFMALASSVACTGSSHTKPGPDAIDPPLPCAMRVKDANTDNLVIFRIEDGRIVASRNSDGIRVGTVEYDAVLRIHAFETHFWNGNVIKTMTRYDEGRLEGYDTQYPTGTGAMRFEYDARDHRPTAMNATFELQGEGQLVEKIRFEYEGAPVWRTPLHFQSGLYFGSARSHSTENGVERLFSVAEYDQPSGRLERIEFSMPEQKDRVHTYLYDEACEGLEWMPDEPSQFGPAPKCVLSKKQFAVLGEEVPKPAATESCKTWWGTLPEAEQERYRTRGVDWGVNAGAGD